MNNFIKQVNQILVLFIKKLLKILRIYHFENLTTNFLENLESIFRSIYEKVHNRFWIVSC